MQNNFNSLQKPNQLSERKCLAVFLKDNKWSFGTVCSNLLSTFDLVGKCPQTIACAFYESLHVAEQFATNFMKINLGIRKL